MWLSLILIPTGRVPSLLSPGSKCGENQIQFYIYPTRHSCSILARPLNPCVKLCSSDPGSRPWNINVFQLWTDAENIFTENKLKTIRIRLILSYSGILPNHASWILRFLRGTPSTYPGYLVGTIGTPKIAQKGPFLGGTKNPEFFLKNQLKF